MSFRNPDWSIAGIKILIFILALLPFDLLFYNAVNNNLGANPIETLTRTTGDWTYRFLLITLCMTPLRRITGWSAWLRVRRMLGLFAFFYGCLHFSMYVLDQYLNVETIIEDILKRPYITVGFTAFIMLWPLAITSNRYMMRRLGRRWQQLHKLVYVTAVLGLLHYLWLIKSDYAEAVVYLVVLSSLFAYRLWWRRYRQPA